MGYAITECEITFLSPQTLRRLSQADGRVAWALAKQMAHLVETAFDRRSGARAR